MKSKNILPFLVPGIIALLIYLQFANYSPSIRVDLFHPGDIIFQTSLSEQSKAIQLATHFKFSHCGIIDKEGTKYYVVEAVQPVKKIPLIKWIDRGDQKQFVVKRLKNDQDILTSEVLNRMRQIEDTLMGKDYDIYFNWSNKQIYCSELIWKVYKFATGLEVGKLQTLRDFDLSSDVVKQKLKERYGNTIPLNDTVISPGNIFDSELLVTIDIK